MKKLTKSELDKYISKIKNDPEYDDGLFRKNDDAVIDFINKKVKEFDYDISETGQNADDILLNIILNDFDQIVTAYEPYSAEVEYEMPSGIELINTEVLNWDEWKKSHEVKRNYESMCDAVNAIKPNNADTFIDAIVAGNDIKLKDGPGGEVAGCKKYEANCPIKLQAGFFPFEFRVPTAAGDSSQRRAYGVCYAKYKKLYMISLYTKNGGQEQANINFDKFMKKAKNYIENNILTESLLYNINEDTYTFKYTNFFDLYEELSIMKEDLGLNSYLEGYRAALEEQLLEDTADESFKAGYKAGEEELATKKDDVLEFYRRHRNVFKRDYQKYVQSKEK